LGAFNQTLGKYVVGGIIGAAVLVGGFLAPMNSAGRVLAADTTCTGKSCTATTTLSTGSNTINYPAGCTTSHCPPGLQIVVPPTTRKITVTWSTLGTFTVKIAGRVNGPFTVAGEPNLSLQQLIGGKWVDVTGITGTGIYRMVPAATTVLVPSHFPKNCTGVCPKNFMLKVQTTGNANGIHRTDKVTVTWSSNGNFTVRVTRNGQALKSWSPAIAPVNVPKGDVLQMRNPTTGKWTKVTSISGPGTYRLHKP